MGEYADDAFDRGMTEWEYHEDNGCDDTCLEPGGCPHAFGGPFTPRRSFTKEEKMRYAHDKAYEEDIRTFYENPLPQESHDQAGVGRWGAGPLAPKNETGETPKMSNTKTSRKPFPTPKFRLSFPNLFQARAAVQGQEPKFSLVMIFEKGTDLAVLKQEVLAAAAEKWGADQSKWPKNITWPFRKGSEKAELGYPTDSIFASASSKMKPGVVDENVQPVMDPNAIYGGCYARATVTTYAWEYMGKAGVSFGLRNVQKWGDGEPFAGKSKPEDDFDAIPNPGGAAAGKPNTAVSAQAAGGPDLGI
jgi:hypothetical protein